MKNSFFISILLLFSLILNAQLDTIGLPIITNYDPITYRAHYQNWDAVQHNDGVLYIANGDGLLTFDGANWNIHEFPNEESARTVTITKSGKIFIAGDNIIGYFTSDSLYQLKFISLTETIPEKYRDFRTIWQIKSFGDTVYARTTNSIMVIVNDSIKVYETEEETFNLFVAEDNLVYLCGINYWAYLKNDSLHEIANDYPFFGIVNKNDSVLGITLDRRLIYFNNDKLSVLQNINYDFGRTMLSDVKLYENKYLVFSTYSGLYITDFNGKIIQKLNKNLGLISTNIYNTFIDNLNNIWALTSNGLSYIEVASPVRLLDERVGMEVAHPTYITILNKKIYVDAGHKTYKISKNKNNEYQVQNIQPANGQSWDELKINEELYIAHNPNIIRIDKNENIKIYGPNKNIWTIVKSPIGEDNYLLGTSTGILLYNYDGDSLKFQRKISDFDKLSRELYFDNNDFLWVGVSHDALYKIKLDSLHSIKNISEYNENKGLTNTNSIQFFEWNDTLLVSTYKNLYFYDQGLDSIYLFHPITDCFDIKNKRILQLVGIDRFKNLWFEYYNDNYDAEVFCFYKQANKYVVGNKFSKRLLNFSIGFVKDFDSTHTVLGTSKGFTFIKLPCDYNDTVKFKPIVSNIFYSTKDSLLFGGYILNEKGSFDREFTEKEKLRIDFKNNNLRFVYSAPFFVSPDKTKYRVMLKNYDENWSSWTTETKKEYTNLQPGSYVFMVEAQNIYGDLSEISNFKIQIAPPWYRTIYAYIFYFLILLIILYGIVKFSTFRLKRKNEKLEELVNERTIQIQQKNSELEQQKEEILTQAEELLMVNNELEKLSAIVRETDNAVILTDKDGNFIWVNNAFTKIFGFTLEELVTKISPNIISDQTDENTKKIINKCLNEKVTVEYELKLKNKYDKDIWIHTTLTPILDDEGIITSLIAIDADITPMKMYEKQIKEQSEQITASIKYARTIQESILPADNEIDAIFDNFIIFKPKDIVSGDFYWISNLFTKINGRLTHVRDENPSLKVGYSTFLAVVDCTGHGVPGAFMSLISSHLLGEIINEQRISRPVEILEHLDTNLSKALKRSATRNYDGMVVSLCRFDKVINEGKIQTKVTFAGAKQHITYYKQSTDELRKIRGVARQIGFVLNQDIKFKEHKFFLEKGDTIFMYSDGLKDLNNAERESFGHFQIKQILNNNINKPISDLGEILTNRMNNWLGDDLQRDDITFLGLRIK